MDADDLFTVVDTRAPEPVREAPSGDVAAPYGRKADGTPYKRRPNRTGGARATQGKGKAETAKAVTDAVTMIYSLVVTVMSTLARLFNSTPLMADSIVTAKGAPRVIPPLSTVVSNNEKLVAICLRLAVITPGVELISALGPLLGQLAANHGMVPGAEDQAERIVKEYEAEVEAAKQREREADEAEVTFNAAH